MYGTVVGDISIIVNNAMGGSWDSLTKELSLVVTLTWIASGKSKSYTLLGPNNRKLNFI